MIYLVCNIYAFVMKWLILFKISSMPLNLFSFLFFILFFVNLNAQEIVINEFQASNSETIADQDGDFEDWIELLNVGNEPINLEGFGLSDDDDQPFKWTFPSAVIEPGEFLLVWASGKNKVGENGELHTNFGISSGGEPLSISNTEGELLDYVEELHLPTNISYGRGVDDEFDVFFYYYEPTPGTSNTTQGFDNLIQAPTFSHNSGFYQEGFNLSITGQSNGTLLYTLDGSEPKIENVGGRTFSYINQYPQNPGQQAGDFIEDTYETLIYEESIEIEDRSNLPNKLANINTAKRFVNNNQPSSSVPKATVVKSRVYNNGVYGPITTHTYFVSDEDIFQTSLPIVSLSLDDSALFDHEDGIYLPGIDFIDWRNENPNTPHNWYNPANYQRRGRETEKSATFQWFESGSLVYQRQTGVRLHGGLSRSRAMKSFRLYARNEYDSSNSFDYPLFGDTNDSSFRRLIMRNSGNDSYNTLLRDAFLQRIVRHLNFDTQDYQPLVHYVNGEYWGLINLRERYDRHYFERVYGIEEGELDFLDASGLTEDSIQEGDNEHWSNLYSFIANNDLNNQMSFLHVKTQMDIENFIDYQLSNIYFRNTDWPGNNIAFFRKRATDFQENAPAGQDGRWRWVMYDVDFGFGLSQNTDGTPPYTHNTLAFATQENGPGWPNPDWSTLVFRRLLTNNEFKNQFVNRYADMINTTFLPERIIPILHDMKSIIEDEIPNMQSRWNTYYNWQQNIQVIENFATQRIAFAREHIQTEFDLAAQHEVTLSVSDEEAGTIQINSIEISQNTPGISQNPYPWTGVYFEGIPVKLKPLPKEGYVFSHWSGDVESMQEEITINLTSDTSITANFVEGGEIEELLYFWLMDNDMPNNTPLENLESTYTHPSFTENATIVYESSLAGYPFNSGHPNWRVASMERRNSPTEINYIPQANDDLAFEEVNMRGLQVREMFQTEEGENMLNIHASTLGFQNIRLAFAVMDEGAVESIQVEYLNDANQWTQTNLSNATFPVFSAYDKVEVDFSDVQEASNNTQFKIRIRFEGEELTENNGNRITFNNISISGSETLSIEIPEENQLVIYPNPVRNILFIEGLVNETNYQIFSIQGKLIQKGKVHLGKINTENLLKGFYLLHLNEDSKVNRFKLIKN